MSNTTKSEISEAIDKFISETEGNRPIVDDPRKLTKIKSELTPEEIAKQEEETEKWINLHKLK